MMAIFFIAPVFVQAQEPPKTVVNALDPLITREMETISYRLPRVEITDSLYWAKLDSLIYTYGSRRISSGAYFRIYMSENDPDYLVIEHSMYPIRLKDGKGYFEHKGNIVMIFGSLPNVFYKPTNRTKVFRYRDYKQPTIFGLEDDIPTWIISTKDYHLKIWPEMWDSKCDTI